MNIIRLFQLIYNRFFVDTETYLRRQGVKIGKNCCIYSRAFGSEPYLVSIGDHVQITAGVKFFTHGGGWLLRNENPDFDCFGKITIKNNVYIGNDTLIMPGVTIESEVLIGAGSVVTKSIPSGWIVAGNPARKIGETKDFKRRILAHNFKTKGLSFVEKRKVILNSNEDLFVKKKYLIE